MTGDLVLNRGDPEWWSFYDVHSPAVKSCGNLTGPMAIIISEETPRKSLVSSLCFFFMCLWLNFGLMLLLFCFCKYQN